MRTVEIAPGYARLTEVEPPPLRADSARVRVTACGVCGTDVHMKHGMVLPRGATYPVHPGHEVAGVVTEVHPEAAETASVGVGDEVVLHPLDTCGTCADCRSGNEQRCARLVTLGMHVQGGLAEEVVWPVSRMVPVPDLPPAQAALLSDAVATAYHALRRADVPPGGSLCVIGAGGVGTHVLKLARALDPSVELVGVVRSEASADRVDRIGAHVVRDLDGAHRTVRELIGPADAVVDFSGARAAPSEGVRILGKGGRLVMGSIVDESMSLGMTISGMTSRELTVVGAYVSTMDELRDVAKLALDGALDLADSVSYRYPLADAVTAIDLVEHRPPGLVRLILEPEGAACR